jgi:transcriptional regulator with XRE-family HTH domain
LRDTRHEKGWTQLQLADLCGVRTQTVSAWENGKRPQRRFFAKIAAFLDLPDEAAVEALIEGRRPDAPALLNDQQEPPLQMADLQASAIKTVIHQLQGGRPSPDLIKLLDNILASVGLPRTSVLGLDQGDH